MNAHLLKWKPLIRLYPLLFVLLFVAKDSSSNFCSEQLLEKVTCFRLDASGKCLDAGFRRYPANINRATNPDGHIMYGFESEYTLDESGRLLEVYGPDVEYGMTKEQWFSTPIEGRIAWVKQRTKDLYGEGAQEIGLVKLNSEPGYEFMPNDLILDSTGNLEIILKPVDTLEEWYMQVRNVNQRFGVGSMQGTVSAPKEAFLKAVSSNAEDVTTTIQFRATKGHMKFMHEKDPLEKLMNGASRWAKDKTKPVANSFQHPFLGPITKEKQELLELYLEIQNRGGKFTDDQIKRVRKSDDSFKYIGSTADRPDIGHKINRIVRESRDAHKTEDVLLERVLRSTYAFDEGVMQYEVWADLPSFDSLKDFQKFSPDTQKFLAEIMPSKAIEGFEYTPTELLAVQVYRNFAYPLRDWSGHIKLLSRSEKDAIGFAQQINYATTTYRSEIFRIQSLYRDGRINKKTALLQTHGALVEWAEKSGIPARMDDWEMGNLVRNEEFNAYAKITLKGAAPLNEAFPSTVWNGTLRDRISRFKDKWPKNVKRVDDVKFKMKDGSYESSRSRDLFVISTYGLNPQEANALLQDYTDSISRLTVSFPTSETPGHLHVRVGSLVYDFTQEGMSSGVYRISGKDRMETLLSLSPLEELNLRTFIENVNKKSMITQPWNEQGVTSGRTKGLLTDNRPTVSGEGHNCTSWICTAPIGKSGEKLYEMAGATAQIEVHTSPGYWPNFIAAGGNDKRVPFLVYWTNDKIDWALEDRIKNGVFEWKWRY